MINITIDDEYDNKKISRLILDKYSITFSGLSKFLNNKDIKLNNKKADVSTVLRKGDMVCINDFCEKILADKIIEQKSSIKNKKSIDLNFVEKIKQMIIYEDKYLLVLNKPKNLFVQGGTGITVSLNDFLPYISNDKNLHLVHRLDKDTTGVLLVGKGNKNSQELIDAFKNKTDLQKYYLAVVYGKLQQKQGEIKEKLVKKYENNIEKVYIDNVVGKEAITQYKVLDYNEKLNISLVLVKILTGRTHQIRVHFKHILHPIVGDFKYNSSENGSISKTVLLHSYNIKINIFDKNYDFMAKPPKIFDELFKVNVDIYKN